jgi:hypothetical protein
MNSFFLSGPEILFTAEQQLEAAGGVADTTFVTVKLTVDETNQIVVEAFQVHLSYLFNKKSTCDFLVEFI